MEMDGILNVWQGFTTYYSHIMGWSDFTGTPPGWLQLYYRKENPTLYSTTTQWENDIYGWSKNMPRGPRKFHHVSAYVGWSPTVLGQNWHEMGHPSKVKLVVIFHTRIWGTYQNHPKKSQPKSSSLGVPKKISAVSYLVKVLFVDQQGSIDPWRPRDAHVDVGKPGCH